MSNALLKTVGAAAAAGIIGYGCFTTYIPPGQVGVKQIKMSPAGMLGETGWGDKELKGGQLYFSIPTMQKIHTTSGELQTLNYNRFLTEMEEDDFAINLPALRIETADAYAVNIDATVLYHVDDAVEVFTKIGPGDLYKKGGLLPRVTPGLKYVFSKMAPEDFFHVNEKGIPKRVPMQEEAKKHLNEQLNPYGITVDAVLIRYPAYDPKVQATFEKNAEQSQLFFTKKALAALAEEQSKLGKLQVEGQQAHNVRKAEGEGYFKAKMGEAQAYKLTKESEANRLVEEAKAESSRLMNEALRGEGSEYLVGLEVADVYKGVEFIVQPVCGPQNNLLDLEAMTKQITGKKQ